MEGTISLCWTWDIEVNADITENTEFYYSTMATNCSKLPLMKPNFNKAYEILVMEGMCMVKIPILGGLVYPWSAPRPDTIPST